MKGPPMKPHLSSFPVVRASYDDVTYVDFSIAFLKRSGVAASKVTFKLPRLKVIDLPTLKRIYTSYGALSLRDVKWRFGK